MTETEMQEITCITLTGENVVITAAHFDTLLSTIRELQRQVQERPMKEIRGIFTGCRCTACGRVAAYHRAGCPCWLTGHSLGDAAMEYGLLVHPDNPGDLVKFVSDREILDHIKAGGMVFDPDGTQITEAIFEDQP